MICLCIYCGYNDKMLCFPPLESLGFILINIYFFSDFWKVDLFFPTPALSHASRKHINKAKFGQHRKKLKSRNECLIIESIMDPIMVYGLILGVGWAHCKECGTKFISMVIIFQARHKAEGTLFFHHLPSLEIPWHLLQEESSYPGPDPDPTVCWLIFPL